MKLQEYVEKQKAMRPGRTSKYTVYPSKQKLLQEKPFDDEVTVALASAVGVSTYSVRDNYVVMSQYISKSKKYVYVVVDVAKMETVDYVNEEGKFVSDVFPKIKIAKERVDSLLDGKPEVDEPADVPNEDVKAEEPVENVEVGNGSQKKGNKSNSRATK